MLIKNDGCEEKQEKKQTDLSKQDNNVLFEKIIDNILEIDIGNRIMNNYINKTFNYSCRILSQFRENEIIINKRKTEDLKDKRIINKRKTITNIKNKDNISEDNIIENNYSDNVSIKKNYINRNFVLKTDLYKLNTINEHNKNNTYKINEGENSNELLITKRLSPQYDFKNNNNNYFYNYYSKISYENNNIENQNIIIPNNFINNDNECYKENMNNSINQINYEDNKTIIINSKEESEINKEEYSFKNIYKDNINLNNIKSKKENTNYSYPYEKEKININDKNYFNNANLINENTNNIYNIYNNNSNYPNQIIQTRNTNINLFNSPINRSNYLNYYSHSDYDSNADNNSLDNIKYQWQNPNRKFNTNLNSYIDTNNNMINNNLYDEEKIAENALNLIKTQSGYYTLKQKLLSNPTFANTLLFPRIKNNLKYLCCDLLGNSLIRILLDLLTYENIDLFIALTKDDLYDISLKECGSRVIQKLIEIIYKHPILINKFIFNLTNKDIGLLIKSPYGNYIIQKFLSVIKKKEFTNFIYDYIFNNFVKIIKEKYGVCVIQKCLFVADDLQRKKIYQYTIENLDLIIKDNYAFFLLQYIFTKYEKRKIEEILPIIEKIEENIVNYCKIKNSAFILEKCFEKGDQEICEHILKNLLENHSDSIVDIVKNPYGFYIIKKIKNINNKQLIKDIMSIIVDSIDTINEFNVANKIITSYSSEFKVFSELLYERNKSCVKIINKNQ